jgi:hypothetical protein
MTNPQCYVCLGNSSSVNHPLGNKGETLAVCQRCHIMVCGSHGQRDRNKSAFICVLCDPNLLQVSAAVKGSSTNAVIKRIVHREDSNLVFESVSDFVRRRPGYDSWVGEIPDWSIDYDSPSWHDIELRDALRELPPDAQELLTAAGLLIFRQEIPHSEIGEDVWQLREALRRD